MGLGLCKCNVIWRRCFGSFAYTDEKNQNCIIKINGFVCMFFLIEESNRVFILPLYETLRSQTNRFHFLLISSFHYISISFL